MARYVYGPGIDEPVVLYRNGQRYFYLLDGLGSVVALIDDSGAVVESYTYDAFGKPAQASTIGNPLLFTAQRYDAESGKYYPACVELQGCFEIALPAGVQREPAGFRSLRDRESFITGTGIMIRESGGS
ncbi:MAG: hypothetical protein NC924_05655 [Candidatus Omnitrophica bacterium]|nr:hypothetical protein [Candidatus Omnitrophota bacterium]